MTLTNFFGAKNYRLLVMGYDRAGDGDKLMLTVKRLWAAEFRGNCSKFY